MGRRVRAFCSGMNGYSKRRWVGAVVAACMTGLVPGIAGAAGPVMEVDVDARELHRQLVHSRITLPVQPGRLGLWYPKWIPGIHAPRGPIENLAGLTVETGEGQRLEWQRDPEDRFRIDCDVPAGASTVTASLRYICNQPNANSKGIDSFGSSLIGVLNWNTVLLYPDGVDLTEVRVRLRVRLPEGWRFATSLPIQERAGNHVTFKTVSFREVMDSPLIGGRHFRSIDLGGKRPSFLHLTSESPGAIQLDDDLIGQYRNLMVEAEALFGAVHYPEYHFLVVCSDRMPTIGLEHLNSSLNAVGERGLIDEQQRTLWPAGLLPHELVHAWCGKYRRPAGMWTGNYHDNKRTDLLWIYEGLTQYLGEVLTVRSGLISPDEFMQQFASMVGGLQHQKGRRWRSLEDTAVDAYHLRARSPSWSLLRRNQDYYNEGLLFWLEVDARIRAGTDDRRSLDDFCREFMGPPDTMDVIKPYELAEVVGILNGLVEEDWEGLIRTRIRQPMPELQLEVMDLIGYRLEYGTKPSDYHRAREQDRKILDVTDSLGVSFDATGKVLSVVPDLAGDTGGLAPGMLVQGVNGRKFTFDRMRDAVADSVTRRDVVFLVLVGEEFQTVTVHYAEGHKYLKVVRHPDRPDRLGDILKGKRKHAE